MSVHEIIVLVCIVYIVIAFIMAFATCIKWRPLDKVVFGASIGIGFVWPAWAYMWLKEKIKGEER